MILILGDDGFELRSDVPLGTNGFGEGRRLRRVGALLIEIVHDRHLRLGDPRR